MVPVVGDGCLYLATSKPLIISTTKCWIELICQKDKCHSKITFSPRRASIAGGIEIWHTNFTNTNFLFI